MKYWEFLIQKEGDQTWLPLETQQVEILEGRYRVVAHTDRVNTPLDIRVSQLITSEMPPRKRVRKRTSKTNETGLVVVMPYVHLKPGQWSLECTSSNVMDDLIGDGWRYGVELDVFGHTEEDWSSEWPVPTDSETVASVIVDTDSPRKLAQQGDGTAIHQDSLLIQAKAELEQQLKSQNPSSQTSQPPKPVFLAASTDDTQLTAAELSQLYRVSLRQQAYLARHNQPMTIMGKVNALVESVPEGIGTETSQLWIRLQNPENTQVIMEAHRPLSLARLPADFKVQIQLPAEVTTRVILGEVSLRTAAIDANTPSVMLTSTAFTITAGIAQLLDSVANQDSGTFDEEVSVFPAITDIDPEARESTNPEISVPALDVTRKDVVPAVGVVLPPQLVERPLAEASLDRESSNNNREEVRSLTAPPTGQPALPTFPSAAEPEHSISSNTTPNATPKTQPDTAVIQAHTPQPSPVTPEETAPETILETAPSMVAQPAQFIGTSILDGDLEADEIAAVLEDIDKDLRAETSALDTLEPPGIEGALPIGSQTHSSQTHSAQTHNGSSQPTYDLQHHNGSQHSNTHNNDHNGSPKKATHADRTSRRQSDHQIEANIGFQSLKLKDHFWNKLSNLTHQSHEEAAKLAKNMKAAGVSRGQSLPTAPNVIADTDEVVIYDDPYKAARSEAERIERALPSASANRNSRLPNPSSLSPNTFTQNPHSQSPIATQPNALGSTLAAGQPFSDDELPEMVMPVISVPMGDLIAGETVTITVRTRPATYKPFIKLWMIDRQSRSLVIDPVLLTSLVPDALGDLEGTVKLQVPMDCLDVQIAAIAVDMATQQESGKAVVNRHVVPAGQATSGRSSFRF